MAPLPAGHAPAPELILPARPDLVALYRRGVEAVGALPRPEHRLLYQWDALAALLWGRYAGGASAVAAADGIYAAQREDGALPLALGPRALFADVEADAAAMRGDGHFAVCMQPAPLAWAEWEFFRTTGDRARLARVLPALARAFDWETTHRARANGYLYWEPPARHPHHGRDVHGWGDYTCQTALTCEALANIALFMDNRSIGDACAANYLALKELANNRLWDDLKKGYLDVDDEDFYTGPLTAGTFWGLLANLPTAEQTNELLHHLTNHRQFARTNPVPVLAASEKGFAAEPSCWEGAVLPIHVYTAAMGLVRAGRHREAGELALAHLTAVAACLGATGNLWERYQPDAPERRAPGARPGPDHATALGPVALMLDAVLGVAVDGDLGEVTFRPTLEQDHGLRGLRVGGATVNMEARWQRDHHVVTVETTARVEVAVAGFVSTKRFLMPGAGTRTVETR